MQPPTPSSPSVPPDAHGALSFCLASHLLSDILELAVAYRSVNCWHGCAKQSMQHTGATHCLPASWD